MINNTWNSGVIRENSNLTTMTNHPEPSYLADYFSAYCKEHNIGGISDEVLKKCFVIPDEGIDIRLYSFGIPFETKYYPIINENNYKMAADWYLGRYCVSNGIVAFVYRDGRTYIAKKNEKLINELHQAGFKWRSMEVLLSDGKEIIDPVLKAKWEEITK